MLNLPYKFLPPWYIHIICWTIEIILSKMKSYSRVNIKHIWTSVSDHYNYVLHVCIYLFRLKMGLLRHNFLYLLYLIYSMILPYTSSQWINYRYDICNYVHIHVCMHDAWCIVKQCSSLNISVLQYQYFDSWYWVLQNYCHHPFLNVSVDTITVSLMKD